MITKENSLSIQNSVQKNWDKNVQPSLNSLIYSLFNLSGMRDSIIMPIFFLTYLFITGTCKNMGRFKIYC